MLKFRVIKMIGLTLISVVMISACSLFPDNSDKIKEISNTEIASPGREYTITDQYEGKIRKEIERQMANFYSFAQDYDKSAFKSLNILDSQDDLYEALLASTLKDNFENLTQEEQGGLDLMKNYLSLVTRIKDIKINHDNALNSDNDEFDDYLIIDDEIQDYKEDLGELMINFQTFLKVRDKTVI